MRGQIPAQNLVNVKGLLGKTAGCASSLFMDHFVPSLVVGTL
jgi:hypothetical protein